MIVRRLARIGLLAAVAAADWPRWRGPNGDGVVSDPAVPARWSATENVLWKVPVPGVGHSSPVVAAGRVYLTTCIDRDRVLLCHDAADGRELWRATVITAPIEAMHKNNTPASSTPAADGSRVWVTFLDGTKVVAACYDAAGKEVWRRAFDGFDSRHGFCGTPVPFENLVLVNGDSDGDAFLAGLDQSTGAVRWKTPRPNRTRSFSTPLLIEVSGPVLPDHGHPGVQRGQPLLRPAVDVPPPLVHGADHPARHLAVGPERPGVREYAQSCPWDNLDGLTMANRRPDNDTQTYARRYLSCPSQEASDVLYNDLNAENLLKANYVACFGGGVFLDACPPSPSHPSAVPNRLKAGAFEVVNGVKKFPTGERFGIGKGVKIVGIADGTSNTLMFSEILHWDQPDGRTSTSHPGGMNRDVRGAMLIPQAGGNTFLANFPPNSKGTDRLLANSTNVPPTDPMAVTATTALDGRYWAAARSRHTGGVNASFCDGSVRFFRDSITPAAWSALGSRAGGEVVNYD